MCVNPLKGFVVGKTDNGKDKYLITSYRVDHIEYSHSQWNKIYEPFISRYADKVIKEFTEIPCGHCVECRLKRSRQWADRCMLEMKYHENDTCWFITLTYDDDHIATAAPPFAGTLVKDDLTRFWKRLRDHLSRKAPAMSLKYLACGEYGPTTLRPHYHAIVFDLPIYDLRFQQKSKTGYPLYTSQELNKIWKNGFVVISPVTWETAAYVARYTLKKAFYDKEDFDVYGLEPEFIVMSQGIGKEYFSEHKDQIYETDELIVSTEKGGKRGKPPKYFDYLLEKEDPLKIKSIKENRKEVSLTDKLHRLSQTDLDYIELKHIDELKISQKASQLKRNKDFEIGG